MPKSDILQGRYNGGANDPSKPRQIFRQDWIPLMRHCGGTLLAFGKELFRLSDFGALQMPDFDRETLDR